MAVKAGYYTGGVHLVERGGGKIAMLMSWGGIYNKVCKAYLMLWVLGACPPPPQQRFEFTLQKQKDCQLGVSE